MHRIRIESDECVCTLCKRRWGLRDEAPFSCLPIRDVDLQFTKAEWRKIIADEVLMTSTLLPWKPK